MSSSDTGSVPAAPARPVTPSVGRRAALDPTPAPRSGAAERGPWWRTAVVYQVYPKSFADGDGDGIGDLAGVAERLDYLAQLGVDALWLSPFYPSPQADGGYDVSDPCDVDPMFGTLGDFDAVLQGAHARGMRITIDLVPNHFSDHHPWFQQAMAAERGSPERARFIFRDGLGEHGDQPPTNWPSVFGGSAWRRVPDGQWYLHLFAPEQPDLNWTNPEVPAEFERIMRFWLDRGVDGFRVDVANSMAKPEVLRDMDLSLLAVRHSDELVMPSGSDPRFDQDGVHEYLRLFRRVLDTYPGERMAVGEAWVADVDRLARYVRSDELNLTFSFALAEATWSADDMGDAIESSFKAMVAVGAPCTWVLSNHDIRRHVSRYGGGARGVARGRAAALVQLALPGSAYLYNGDELGLPNVDDLPDDVLQDPTWERSGHTDRGRDGERVPLPWEGSVPPFGFSSNAQTWLPMPGDWASLTVEAQLEDGDSTLSLYRRALELRRETSAIHGEDFTWLAAPAGCLAFCRGADFALAINMGDEPADMPPGQVLLASGHLGESTLPPDTAVWLRL